jgi:hypothetical protein
MASNNRSSTAIASTATSTAGFLACLKKKKFDSFGLLTIKVGVVGLSVLLVHRILLVVVESLSLTLVLLIGRAVVGVRVHLLIGLPLVVSVLKALVVAMALVILVTLVALVALMALVTLMVLVTLMGLVALMVLIIIMTLTLKMRLPVVVLA